MRCPGHRIMTYTGPSEDDYDPDIDYCDGSCQLERVLHTCVDCGHDQHGTLNLTTGWWECSICRHRANLNHGIDDNGSAT